MYGYIQGNGKTARIRSPLAGNGRSYSALLYLSKALLSFLSPRCITQTKSEVSTNGTRSRLTPNLNLEWPRKWPKSMWNIYKQVKWLLQNLQYQAVPNSKPRTNYLLTIIASSVNKFKNKTDKHLRWAGYTLHIDEQSLHS